MSSLNQKQILKEISKLFYNFLPGNPHPFADPSISFKGIAEYLNIQQFWKSGSKEPAILNLLEKTYSSNEQTFANLIYLTVERGMTYRTIYFEEIETLNSLLEKLHFSVKKLKDSKFLSNLPKKEIKENVQKTTDSNITEQKRGILLDSLSTLEKLVGQERGYAFERFLNEFFKEYGLKPRSPFKITGEQIDGSFELDYETYVLEAKFTTDQTDLKELDSFNSKIKRKASWTRGLFIGYNGFTKEAKIQFERTGPLNFFVLIAQDLYFILKGNNGILITLKEALKLKERYAAESGDIWITIFEILQKNLY